MLAPLLLLSMAAPPAAHARRQPPAPAAATVATAPQAAQADAQQPAQQRPWRFSSELTSIDPTKLTVLQTADAFSRTPEGQVVIKLAAFTAFMYVVTRRPDPPSGKQTNPYAAVTKSWIVTRQGSTVKVVEVDPATLPKPPPPPPPAKPSASSGSGSGASTVSSRASPAPKAAASSNGAGVRSSNGSGSGSSSPEPGAPAPPWVLRFNGFAATQLCQGGS